jgi:hypothetical protein
MNNYGFTRFGSHLKPICTNEKIILSCIDKLFIKILIDTGNGFALGITISITTILLSVSAEIKNEPKNYLRF